MAIQGPICSNMPWPMNHLESDGRFDMFISRQKKESYKWDQKSGFPNKELKITVAY